MAQESRRGFWYGWIILAAAFLGYGVSMGLTVYLPPVAMAEMIVKMNWPRAEGTLPVTVATWLGVAIYPFIGWAINRFGGRKIVTVGFFGMTVIFLLLSQVSELWQWFVLRGVLWPMLAFLMGILPFQTITVQWFNLRRGLGIGTMFLGGGVFGFLAPPVVSAIMEAFKSWQMGWVVAAVASAVAGLFCGLLLRSKPSDIGQYADGLTPEEAQRAREAARTRTGAAHRAIARTYRTPVAWNVRDAMRTRAIWLIVICWACMSSSFSFYISSGHALLHFRGMGYSAMEAALTISVFNLVNSPGRFLMGWLSDQIEARFIFAVGTVFALAAGIMAWTIPPGNMFLLYAYAILWGLGWGFTYPVIAPWVGNYYGAANFAPINGSIVLPFAAIFSGMVPVGAGYIYETFKDYNLAFAVILAVSVISLGAALLAVPPRPKAAPAT